MKESDFRVSIENGTWSGPEVISRQGYQPARRFPGAKVSVTYHGKETFRWLNVDVYLLHNGRYTSVGGEGENISIYWNRIKGAEVKSVPINVARVEEGAVAYQELGSIYSDKFKVRGLGTSFHLLRIYGETSGGVKFSHQLSDFNPPRVTVQDQWCFIANAAFEDKDHPTVKELRRVRDELLKPRRSGRAFIKFYYRHSPRIAAWMADRPRVKRAMRAILTPLARTTRALSTLRREGWRSLLQHRP